MQTVLMAVLTQHLFRISIVKAGCSSKACQTLFLFPAPYSTSVFSADEADEVWYNQIHQTQLSPLIVRVNSSYFH